ncbi:MAG: MarR family winged helix-turn-helix transcriptional regulator, partial [Fusobacteriaceae bacterium]
MHLELKETIGKYITILSRKSHLFLTKELLENQCDILPGQIMFLMTLYNHGSVRQDNFHQLLHIDKGNSAKSLKNLEELGYISRVRDEKDRRVYNVFPTEKALELKPLIFSILKKLDNSLGNNLSFQEYNQLLTLL